MAPSSQELEPPQNPGRFNPTGVLPPASIARFEALFKTINERLARHAARDAAPFR